MKPIRQFFVFAAVAWCVSGAARPLTPEQKLADFHYLASVIEAGYGPLEFKQTNKVISPQLNGQFEQEIGATQSNQDFYYKMVEYVAAYQDGHFGMYLPSDRAAFVPVVTDLVDGKVLITQIRRDKLPESQFNFQVGDEITSVDGVRANQALEKIGRYIGSGNPASVRRFAAWSLFNRRAQRMPLPSEKSVQVEIRRGTSELIEPATLNWSFVGNDPENPSEVVPLRPLSAMASVNFGQLDNPMVRDFVHREADSSYACSPDTRIEIPKDATVIMKSPFVAYYHPTAKGNVGYLRIPHYSPQPGPGENPTDVTLRWVNTYHYAISQLEKNTVGLVIDQDHNCGGSVWVVHKILAMFMDKPFPESQFQLLASKEGYLDLKGWASETPEYTFDREGVDRVLKLVEDTWLKGTSRLTPMIAIDGQETFPNETIHYTKPIVMLIDEVAGSGGDMFPAMMKGLGRAKLFGQRTSGLGGHVTRYPARLPNSQLVFRMTKSLFYDPNGQAIENHGAVPDQTYTITRNDVLYGFKEYRQQYLNYLLSMLP
jgi:hypothetical protein